MDDTRDIEALRRGDKAAWDGFVARYAAVIFAAAHRRLGPAGRANDVEDVVQEVFVKLCRNDFKLLRSYDPARAKVSTWLTVIATTTAIDHLRRHARPTQALEDAPASELAVDPPSFERIKIPEGLLSTRQAAVLSLLYDRDLDPAEVGRLLGIAPQTVRSMHHKALTKLRAHFRQEEDG
jgi:RNA polymerase sigma-70 factor (ECF subfamily)